MGDPAPHAGPRTRGGRFPGLGGASPGARRGLWPVARRSRAPHPGRPRGFPRIPPQAELAALVGAWSHGVVSPGVHGHLFTLSGKNDIPEAKATVSIRHASVAVWEVGIGHAVGAWEQAPQGSRVWVKRARGFGQIFSVHSPSFRQAIQSTWILPKRYLYVNYMLHDIQMVTMATCFGVMFGRLYPMCFRIPEFPVLGVSRVCQDCSGGLCAEEMHGLRQCLC